MAKKNFKNYVLSLTLAFSTLAVFSSALTKPALSNTGGTSSTLYVPISYSIDDTMSFYAQANSGTIASDQTINGTSVFDDVTTTDELAFGNIDALGLNDPSAYGNGTIVAYVDPDASNGGATWLWPDALNMTVTTSAGNGAVVTVESDKSNESLVYMDQSGNFNGDYSPSNVSNGNLYFYLYEDTETSYDIGVSVPRGQQSSNTDGETLTLTAYPTNDW